MEKNCKNISHKILNQILRTWNDTLSLHTSSFLKPFSIDSLIRAFWGLEQLEKIFMLRKVTLFMLPCNDNLGKAVDSLLNFKSSLCSLILSNTHLIVLPKEHIMRYRQLYRHFINTWMKQQWNGLLCFLITATNRFVREEGNQMNVKLIKNSL